MQSLLAVTDYSTATNSTTSAATSGTTLVIGMFYLVFVVLLIVGLWKMFKKAGHPGWAALIPIYNFYIMLKIAGRPAWWLLSILLAFIPIVGAIVSIAVSIIVGMDIAKRFGRSTVFGVILNGILGIGYLIIGFGSSTYQGATAQTGPVIPTASAPPVTPPSTPPTPPTPPTSPPVA